MQRVHHYYPCKAANLIATESIKDVLITCITLTYIGFEVYNTFVVDF